MEAAAALGVLWSLLLLVVGILVFLTPFFILKIRNELVSINRKMSTLIEILDRPKENIIPRLKVDITKDAPVDIKKSTAPKPDGDNGSPNVYVIE